MKAFWEHEIVKVEEEVPRCEERGAIDCGENKKCMTYSEVRAEEGLTMRWKIETMAN